MIAVEGWFNFLQESDCDSHQNSRANTSPSPTRLTEIISVTPLRPIRIVKQTYFTLMLMLLLNVTANAESLDYPNRYNSMAESMFDMMDAFSSSYNKRLGSENPGGGNWSMNSLTNPMSNASSMPGANPWSMGSMPGGMPTLSPWSMPGSMGGMPSGMPGSMGGMPGSMGSMPGISPWTMPGGMTNSIPGNIPFNQWNRFIPSEKQNDYKTPLDGRWQGQTGEILAISNGRFRIYQQRNKYKEGQLFIQQNNRLVLQHSDTGNSSFFEYAESNGQLVLRGENGQLLLFRRIDR